MLKDVLRYVWNDGRLPEGVAAVDFFGGPAPYVYARPTRPRNRWGFCSVDSPFDVAAFDTAIGQAVGICWFTASYE